MSYPIRMRSGVRIGVPERTPTNERTNGRTNEEPLSPTRDNPSFVTHTPAYRFSQLSDSDDDDTIRTAAAILTLIGADPWADWHLADLADALGRSCRITKCSMTHKALGLCDTHYRAHLRAVANEAHLTPKSAKKGQAA